MSKAAVEALSEILAQELENVSHVRVNTINPGATRTAMRLQAYPSENPDDMTPPEDIVGAYVALAWAEPISRGITGQRFDAPGPRSKSPQSAGG